VSSNGSVSSSRRSGTARSLRYESSNSTTGPGRSPTTTIESSSGRSVAAPRRRFELSSRGQKQSVNRYATSAEHVGAQLRATLESLSARGGVELRLLRLRRDYRRLLAARTHTLAELGDAVYRGDDAAADAARQRVAEVHGRLQAKEGEMTQAIARANQRMNRARLETQPTVRLEAPVPVPEPSPVPSPVPAPVPVPEPSPVPSPPTPRPVPVPEPSPEPHEPPQPGGELPPADPER
jgi:hypothetical protein